MFIKLYRCRQCLWEWDVDEDETPRGTSKCPKCDTSDVFPTLDYGSNKFIGDWETNDHRIKSLKKDPGLHEPEDLVDWDKDAGEYVPVNAKGERV
jgi:hypothetical protein